MNCDGARDSIILAAYGELAGCASWAHPPKPTAEAASSSNPMTWPFTGEIVAGPAGLGPRFVRSGASESAAVEAQLRHLSPELDDALFRAVDGY